MKRMIRLSALLLLLMGAVAFADSKRGANPTTPPRSTSCCKVCKKGCPCVNSCISCSKVCHKPPGWACR